MPDMSKPLRGTVAELPDGRHHAQVWDGDTQLSFSFGVSRFQAIVFAERLLPKGVGIDWVNLDEEPTDE